jgi:RNA polymerase sigma-70 factor (ECF subfamily)
LLISESSVDFKRDPAPSPEVRGVDRPTFEHLYREHFRLAWRAIRKAGVRRPEVIEELVHDVFLVVHRRMPELDQQLGSARGWIYRISVYVALNHLSRAHVRREQLMDHTEQEETLAASGDTESDLADREHLRLLLASTTPERREVYELAEVEGFTIPEIAAALEIAETTADSRLRLARRDMLAAEARLQRKVAARRLAILPLGTGAWLHLRDGVTPPAGAGDRVWAQVQSTIRAQGGGADESPKRRENTPGKGDLPWSRRAAELARRALVPSLAAVGGAVSALIYAQMTQAPPRVIAIRFPVAIAQEAEVRTIVPDALPEGVSAALVAPGVGGAPDKPANPAALLALRRAQAAYVIGDKPGALEALGAFDGELSGDPLRSNAARLRALVMERDEGVR